jgi:hypothetical protein
MDRVLIEHNRLFCICKIIKECIEFDSFDFTFERIDHKIFDDRNLFLLKKSNKKKSVLN